MFKVRSHFHETMTRGLEGRSNVRAITEAGPLIAWNGGDAGTGLLSTLR